MFSKLEIIDYFKTFTSLVATKLSLVAVIVKYTCWGKFYLETIGSLVAIIVKYSIELCKPQYVISRNVKSTNIYLKYRTLITKFSTDKFN